jgi:2-polyprenyl-3-methyl-5-hydroxy-6-metoxy-1,4-benzoquinol methylase
MNDSVQPAGEYHYADAAHTPAHAYLLPKVEEVLSRHGGTDRRLFDLGCGSGAVAHHLAQKGYSVTGIDPSTQGIRLARQAYPGIDLHVGSAYEPLSKTYGAFPVVLSLEVVEHLYAPRDYARTLAQLVEPKGIAIVSTPYHGYWKNLAMALSGKLDDHFTVLWDHGHIKFWSVRTLTQLLLEAGLEVIEVHRVGRIPVLAKSMILVARHKDGN